MDRNFTLVIITLFIIALTSNLVYSQCINPDSDNDGICDALDLCPGFNDLVDVNNNSIPDACDKALEISNLSPYFYYDFENINADQFFNDITGNSTCEWGQNDRPNLVSGIKGNAFSFENNAAFFKANSYGNFKVGNKAHASGFSISFWIKIDYDASRDNITRIFDQQNVFDVLFQNNGILVRNFAGQSYTISGANIFDNNWHHITASFDIQKTTDNIHYYVDNTLIHTTSYTFENGFSRADQRKVLHIGSRHGGGYSGNMSLDEVATFDRPITSYEVNQLYQVNQLIEQNSQEITLQINDGKTQITEGISSVINLNATTNMSNIQNIEWEVIFGNATIQNNGGLSTSILMNDNSNYQHAKILLRISNGNHEKDALINVVRTKENAPNVRSLSPLPAPGVHPRILFGPADLPDMRSRYATAAAIQRGKERRLIVDGIKSLPKTERTSEHYTLLSYDALMINDPNDLTELADDFTLYVSSKAQNHSVLYNDRYNGDVDWNIGFTYDFLFNSMNVNQRSIVRSFIAKMIAHRATFGSFSEGSQNDIFEFTSNNTTHTAAYATVCAAAIEGEEGAMPELIQSNEDILRTFLCKYGVLESGFPREGAGYYSLGMRLAAFSCIIHARRGENFFETSNFYKSLEIGFREQQPWSLGAMYSHHDGQIFENGGPSGDMFWIAKYMYPNDLMVDYHVKAFDENRSYGYQFAGIGLFTFGMNSLANNLDPGVIGSTLQYSTTAADLTRGIINTRNKWGDDMVRLDFECRMDLYNFGHMHADRNSFTLSGYGRQWISDNNYHATKSDKHSTILIDGLAADCLNRPMWPSAPGVLLRYEDEEDYMLTQGDATFFYNYGNNWNNPNLPQESLNKTWEDFSFHPSLVPEPKRNKNTGNWGRVDTIEKALRSVIFKKGDYPFALIVDDIKKDNTSREYEWVANLPHSFDYYNPFWFDYEILKQNNEELIFKYEQDTMANAPQLQIKLLDAAGTPDSIRLVKRDFNGLNLNLISIKRENVVEPNFKVLLYPHRAGFPIPQTYWNNDMSLLSVFIDDEVTYVEFTEDSDGRTVVNIVELDDICSPSSVYGNIDSDGDSICDALDICNGYDDLADTDADNIPNSCDICPNDLENDADNDGVCEENDLCPNFDDSLIGNNCDDNDSCTDWSIYNSNCECAPKVNYALSGNAQMSSTGFGAVASNLIDGDLNSMAHTNAQSVYDWMEIDLGANKEISDVLIWNRINCCLDRLENVYLLVSDTPFPNTNDLNAAISNASFIHQYGTESNKAAILVSLNTQGRYVRLQKSGNNGSSNYLNINEFQILGDDPNSDIDNDGICEENDVCPNFDNSLIGTNCDDNDACTEYSIYDTNCECVPKVNYALNGNAQMSSTGFGSVAANIVDGDLNSLAHTNAQSIYDWMEIDLGAIQEISDVLIWNRTDCCSDRLENVYLLVSETPFPNTNDLNSAISNASFIHQFGTESNTATILVSLNIQGRYVRIQKSGNNGPSHYLNIAEIQILGEDLNLDQDQDGFCEDTDQCPNFDDNLIAQTCDDGDACTINDVYDTNCNCNGTLLLIDADNNNICDADQPCLLFMNLNNVTEQTGIYKADDFIHSSSTINSASNGTVYYQVGDEYILLDNGFSADGTVDFVAEIEDCDLN